jgi:hypothetical protein
MTNALYTPRFNRLGGDAEYNWLVSQIKELDCRRVLGV